MNHLYPIQLLQKMIGDKEAPGEFTVTIQAPADDTNFTVADAPQKHGQHSIC